MAKYKEKSKAIELRKKGLSYGQIKDKLRISKGTLSTWLRDYPLSKERIRELRDNNPIRIERYISTMKNKREEKLSTAFEKVKKQIGKISRRDLLIAGFFLYWAEGGKTNRNALTFTNTDPAMLRIYIRWLEILGVKKEKLKFKLHIYRDMKENSEIKFWSNELGISNSQFRKTWVKDSNMSHLTYKNNFGHGTCNIILHNTEMTTYILMGIKLIANV